MFKPEQVRYLLVEATTRCNAWCPGCHRNQGGFQLESGLELIDLDPDKYQQLLDPLINLDTIDFCGTYGDAVAAKNIEQLIDISLDYCRRLIIKTNGSLRSAAWWKNLAEKFQGIPHEVHFCLDGLKDTHSIYRQATDWQHIIDNAQTFINAGGTAVWQFIPWAHNEHQILDCIRLSQELKFSRFELVKAVRTDFRGYLPRHYQTGQVINIQPWSHSQKFNRYLQNNQHINARNCRHLTDPSLYINADGTVSTCCFFQMDRRFESYNDLPDIASELVTGPHPRCLEQCGVPNC